MSPHPSALAESLGMKEAALLAPFLDRVQVDAGEHVFTDGECAARVVFVVRGKLEAAYEADHSRVVLGDHGPGSWLGEVGFIDKGPATATVTATEPTELLSLHHDRLLTLAEDHPEVASVLLRHVTRVLADRLHRSSSGILRQVSDEQFLVEHVEHVEQNRSWLSRTLSWLVGASEAS